ncbi:hypothetical protein GUITHDRAFT_136980 [Guillardia theta CCMP2712]|uniref:Uncharacterized protein n=2 Tax=Guillardia theta TaxID=55529 RepID=L1JIN8_GUITC|nr:hypothetical protein GUITHDRAFT_136980 [Guillardia theta CCMP2712]EKX48019.1 hypothetical protein GUITHDRAFT_136980 [Guillardia theta CCMP2712]|eukprot:XP_005834999.1 hypothetical protein GUITHDRAFT_136980 [Guillardia theta CCMP2712]
MVGSGKEKGRRKEEKEAGEEEESEEEEQRKGVTLVTQLSWNKFSSLLVLRPRWAGPCVAAVLVPSSQSSEFHEGVQELQQSSHDITQIVAVWEDELHFERYPINAMRNIALAHAGTDLVFLCDVDQLPSVTFSALLQQEDILMLLWRWCCVERNAIVVPALELKKGGGEAISLEDVLGDYEMAKKLLHEEDLEKTRVIGFQTEKFPTGHAAERVRELWTACESIEGYMIEYEEGFEPYVIVSRQSFLLFLAPSAEYCSRWMVPAYDERYEGYGRNKVSHIRRMAVQGFHFRVCFKAYVVHQEHELSRDAQEFYDRENNSRLEQIKHLDMKLAEIVRNDPFSRTCCYCPQFDKYCGQGLPGPLGLWRDQKHHSQQLTTYGKLSSRAITAVSHCSLSHLVGAIRQLRHWNDNAVLSILVPDGFIGRFLACCARWLVSLSLVGCQGQLRIVTLAMDRNSLSALTRGRYPSNLVRSVGLAVVETKWSLLVDADLLPSHSLARRLDKFLSSSQKDELTVLVVPTFEASRVSDVSSILRAARGEMAALMHASKIRGFHLDHYREGHGATDFEKWVQLFHPDHLSSYDIEYEDGFEPYVVVSTRVMQALNPPLYDTRFRHPYADKVSAFRRLSREALRWSVFTGGFFLSMPHTPSTSKRRVEMTEEEEFFFAASYGLADRSKMSSRGSETASEVEGQGMDELRRTGKVIWQGFPSLDDTPTLHQLFASWDSDVKVDAGNVTLVQGVHDSLGTESAMALKVSLAPRMTRGSSTSSGGLNSFFRLPLLPHDFVLQYQVLFPAGFQCGEKGGRLPGFSLGEEILGSFWRWTSNSNFVLKCFHKPLRTGDKEVSVQSTRLLSVSIVRDVWTRLSIRLGIQSCKDEEGSVRKEFMRITIDAFVNHVHCSRDVFSLPARADPLYQLNLLDMRTFFGGRGADSGTSGPSIYLSDLQILQQ